MLSMFILIIQLLGNIEQDEMYKVFNMGIGMTLIVDQQSAESIQKIIESTGLSSARIGTIRENGTGAVQIIWVWVGKNDGYR